MCDDKSNDPGKKRVLVVDDDADFVEASKAVLEGGGYEVTVAYDGKECLEQVGSNRPDVILLDMMMETWSAGSTVLNQLRESDETKEIPIILASSVNFRSPLADTLDTVDSAQADSYMMTPIEPGRLLAEVEKATS